MSKAQASPSDVAVQPDDTDALQHGPDAQHYAVRERMALPRVPALEALDDIEMLRSTLDHALALIQDCDDDDDRRVKLNRALFAGTERLLAAMRTHTLVVGVHQQRISSVWDALELLGNEHDA